MLNKKHNLKSGNAKISKKGFQRTRQETKKRERIDEKELCNWIFWCCSFHETKAKEEPKESTKERQEGRKKGKNKIKTEQEKLKKGGGQKTAKEKQRETLKNKQKMPFSAGGGVPLEAKKGEEKINKKKQTNKKHKNTKKELFSYQSISSFFVGVQNFPVLTTWPKKRAPKKHNKNRGFRKASFEKEICVTKRQFLDKKTQIQKFQLSLLLGLFLLFQQQKAN